MEPHLSDEQHSHPHGDGGPVPGAGAGAVVAAGGSGVAPLRPDELLAELRAVRQELADAEAVHAARWQQLAAALDVTEPGLAALRVDLADALEAVRDRVVRSVDAATGATSGALEATTGAVTEVVHGLREVLLDRVEEHQSVMRARMADVTAQLQAGSAATRATQERLAALTTATDQLQRTVQVLQVEWDASVERAAERLLQAAGEAAEVVGARLVEQLQAARGMRSSDDALQAVAPGAEPLLAAPRIEERSHVVVPAVAAAAGPAQDEEEPPGGFADQDGEQAAPDSDGPPGDRSFQPRRRPQWRRGS